MNSRGMLLVITAVLVGPPVACTRTPLSSTDVAHSDSGAMGESVRGDARDAGRALRTGSSGSGQSLAGAAGAPPDGEADTRALDVKTASDRPEAHAASANVEIASGHCDDVAADFLPAGTNPHGVWSYGWAADLGSPMELYATFGSGLPSISGSSRIDFWYINTDPSVFYNPTSSNNHFGMTVTLHPSQFAMHPGPKGQESMVRWTATSSGTYSIAASFSGISGYKGASVTTTDVHVRHNENVVPGGSGYVNLNGFGNMTTFNLKAAVKAGDTIDFVVGYGNGNYVCDSTALAAKICRRARLGRL